MGATSWGASERRLARDCRVWMALMLRSGCAGFRTAVDTAATTSRNLCAISCLCAARA